MSASNTDSEAWPVDALGFLTDFRRWDEAFAETRAADVGIPRGVTPRHWLVIRYLRKSFQTTGRCPLVYQTCRACNLRLNELRELFPTGYQRGACRLAGLTYRDHDLPSTWVEEAPERPSILGEKTYRVDLHGFLAEPSEWDRAYAQHKALEMKMALGLTPHHWRIITYLRDAYARDGRVPTVYQTCEDNSLELSQLEELFPDGYHRGAVKIAGLRME